MKKLIIIKLLLVCVFMHMQAQTITTGSDNKSWTLQTKSAIYQIAVDNNGMVNMMYFGDKSQDVSRLNRRLGDEVTVRGGFSSQTPMLEVIFPDKVRDIELIYDRSEVQQIDGYATLILHQKDKFYSLAVTEYLRVLPEYDIIEKWVEIKNTGKKGTIKVENVQSGTFFLPKDFYELTHFSGIWGTEFQPQTTKLTQGLKTLQVKDFRSFGSSAFVIRPEGESCETEGKVWFGSLHYSGNWRVDFEKYPTGLLQVTSGINFWDQEVYLKQGQSFTTPKMSIGYTKEGMQGVSQNLAAYTREKILPAAHRNQVRPVLYNSWYATTFDVNEEHQLALAKIAKEIGVEMFVIDDGWFKGRINDKGGLGDWTVDKNKFPNGLQPMIEKINAMGLDFGIWIEPEMVNPNSDLYRAHPDWVFHYPNRTRHEGRNQLILNLAREDVYNYLYDSFYKLLKENNIKFIKWDMNKAMSDPGFPSAPTEEQRMVRIKYVENLYRLIESLRKEFPEVWFENCASGGGRIDLGMMARTDFSWVSDNTDPVERIFIQHAYLNLFPANTMISWITHEDWHRQNHPLEYKFDVSMAGVLGIGYDITKWTEEEKKIAKDKIAQYKDIRKTVQFGTHYRLVSPYENNRSILQFVDKGQSESIVFVYNLGEYPNNAIPETKRSYKIQLRGLDPNRTYKIDGMDGEFKGDYLLNSGIEFPVRGAFKSRIFKIKSVLTASGQDKSLKKENFKMEINGKTTRLYTLHNRNGTSAQFTNYGGRWLSMWVADAKGKFDDVVLGFDDLKSYLHAAEGYHGAITGRVCGRIKNGVFSLNGKTYRLANNDLFGKPEKNHLHGGYDGFHKKIWDGTQGVNDTGEEYVEFSYLSVDGEEGYPGNLDVKVRYTLSQSDEIRIDYWATTDKTTLVNLTNHAFFNLSGNPSQAVSDHVLHINSDTYIECDQELIPTGNIIPLKGLPIDFSTPTSVGKNIHVDFPEIVKDKGFAIAYLINPADKELRYVASLTEPISKRTLEIYSNQPSLQVYNAWLMDGSDIGKNNIPYNCGAGIALETQGFPDAPNHPRFSQITLEPDMTYHHLAIYKFGVSNQ